MNPSDNFVSEFDQGYRFGHQVSTVAEMKERPISIKHSHPRYEIYLLVSGHVEYTVAGTVYRINPGDVVVMNAYVLHSVEVAPDVDYERYVLEFAANNIPIINGINPINRFFNTNEFIRVIPKEQVDKSNLPHILRRMERDYDPSDIYCKHILYSNITLFVVELAKFVEKEEGLTSNLILEEGPNRQAINGVIQYINSHLAEDLSIDSVARASGFSRSYLQHLFTKIVGMSISKYILAQKMQVANFLLRNGESLQKIASDLGYKYYPTFSIAYKRFFGYSPKENKK
ncbi:MAG: AraC family transcriptional regulator [Bacilli bacterium]|nr:AraC family transcriptional regulator [Bacilli bacterium]